MKVEKKVRHLSLDKEREAGLSTEKDLEATRNENKHCWLQPKMERLGEISLACFDFLRKRNRRMIGESILSNVPISEALP